MHSWLLDVTVLGDRFLPVTFIFFVFLLVSSIFALLFNGLSEVVMAYGKRRRMTRRKSRRDFSRKSGTNKRNFRTAPMRGGIRL